MTRAGFIGALALAACASAPSLEPGQRAELVASVCPASPGTDDCARYMVREDVLAVAGTSITRRWLLTRVERQISGAGWRDVPICNLISPYILFPVDVRTDDDRLQSVAYDQVVDAECGPRSELSGSELDDFQEGCATSAQCADAGFDVLYQPYLTAPSLTDNPFGGTIRVVRTPIERTN